MRSCSPLRRLLRHAGRWAPLRYAARRVPQDGVLFRVISRVIARSDAGACLAEFLRDGGALLAAGVKGLRWCDSSHQTRNKQREHYVSEAFSGADLCDQSRGAGTSISLASMQGKRTVSYTLIDLGCRLGGLPPLEVPL